MDFETWFEQHGPKGQTIGWYDYCRAAWNAGREAQREVDAGELQVAYDTEYRLRQEANRVADYDGAKLYDYAGRVLSNLAAAIRRQE